MASLHEGRQGGLLDAKRVSCGFLQDAKQSCRREWMAGQTRGLGSTDAAGSGPNDQLFTVTNLIIILAAFRTSKIRTDVWVFGVVGRSAPQVSSPHCLRLSQPHPNLISNTRAKSRSFFTSFSLADESNTRASSASARPSPTRARLAQSIIAFI